FIDVAGHFHLICLIFTSHRRGSDYHDALGPLFANIEDYMGLPFTPAFLISDASDAIFNAFHELRPIESYVHLMCFAHVEQTKLNRIFSKDISKTITLRKILSEWKENYTLMQESCKVNGIEKFFEYFEDTWGNNGKFTCN
ncbi:hypothetical protein ROZALSC1DRAFT_25250, partial [Rozella allomycis CSF55]